MKKLALPLMGAITLVAATAPAAANIVVVNDTVEAHAVDYIAFNYTGGAISLFTIGDWFGPSLPLLDPMIRLFADDGSPFGALTGALLGTADDDIGLNPVLNFGSLAAGDYILAVGSFNLTEAEARSGGADRPFIDADYIATLSGSGHITLNAGPVSPAVPEPATWAMLVGGFALAGLAMRRSATRVAFS